MRIVRHRNFKKRYQRLDKYMREKANLAMEKFQRNPFDPILRNHALKGDMVGRRAISVTGDVRIIFEEHDDYVLVIMLDVGTHNQIYLS